MQVEVGAPMLLIDSIGYLEDGTPIEYYHAVHRGDRTRFQVELVRAREVRGVKGDRFSEADRFPFSTIEVLPQRHTSGTGFED
jgi:GntR family transcriptional regulator